MKWKYEDIVHLSRPQSAVHPPMDMIERAAQFAPFAALTGYDGVIQETARYVDKPVELTDSAKEELNQQFRLLVTQLNQYPRVTLTHYIPDDRKAGGCYVKTTGNLRRVDEYTRELELVDSTRVDMDTVISVETAEE